MYESKKFRIKNKPVLVSLLRKLRLYIQYLVNFFYNLAFSVSRTEKPSTPQNDTFPLPVSLPSFVVRNHPLSHTRMKMGSTGPKKKRKSERASVWPVPEFDDVKHNGHGLIEGASHLRKPPESLS